MCGEDFFLSLKANNELFNFLQQATLLLTFASSLLSFFAFRSSSESGFQEMQKLLQGISMGLWAFSSMLIFTVLMAYIWESRYQPAKNAWGETIYSQKGSHKYNEMNERKKLKRQKVSGRNNNRNNDKNILLLNSISPSSSTYGSSNTPPFRSLGTSPSNMSTSDVIVNMSSVAGSTVTVAEESCWSSSTSFSLIRIPENYVFKYKYLGWCVCVCVCFVKQKRKVWINNQQNHDVSQNYVQVLKWYTSISSFWQDFVIEEMFWFWNRNVICLRA